MLTCPDRDCAYPHNHANNAKCQRCGASLATAKRSEFKKAT